MRRPPLVLLLLLIAPALAGAQESRAAGPATTPAPHSAPAPADDGARAPARSNGVQSKSAQSKSIFGQAMAELTRSVEQSRAQRSQPAATQAVSAAPAATTPAAAVSGRDDQVAVQDPAN